MELIDNKALKITVPNEIVDRIKFDPKKIQDKIRKWFMSFNIDINGLSGKSANSFAVGRIFFRGDIKKIKLLKEKSKELDDLLGLKRDEMNLRNIYSLWLIFHTI